jgi:polyisoprenyl-phosphate glycosyltransferase
VKLISIVTACSNEEENVREVYEQVRTVMATLPCYDYEHVFVDSTSSDSTVGVLCGMS